MKNIPLYDVRQIANLKEMLDSSATLYSDKAAFLMKLPSSDAYSSISYAQFKKDVDAFGTALIYLGLKDKRIAVIGENRYEWSVSYLATVNGTGIIIPLDKELPPNEIESLLVRSKANAVIYSPSKAEEINNISKNIDTVDFYIHMSAQSDEGSVLSFHKLLEKGYELLNNGNTEFTDATIDNEAVNILLFTSGTTDTSKAVMLSHKNIVTNLMAQCSMLKIVPDDIFLSILPIHHTYECTCGYLCPLYRGAAIAYCEGLRHIAKNLKESKATVMLGVPLIFEAIHRHIWDQATKAKLSSKLKLGLKISNFLRLFGIDLTKKLFSAVHDNFGGKVRLFISGAAGIDPQVSKGFRDLGILFVQGYGLTECSPIVTLNRDVDYRDDSAGLPLPNLEIRIDSPSAEGIGEIVLKGPSVMHGYYEDEESTKKVIKDGWFYTGDLGYIDNSKFIYITGRKKNVIVTKNGKNIYPEEIESLLNKSDYIKESLVFGENDDVYNDVIVSAVIVPDIDKIQESFPQTSLTPEFIFNTIQIEVKAVNKNLVIYKYIKDFRLRDTEFIKTSSKKIKRYMETKVESKV